MPVPDHVRDDGSACPAPRCGGIQNSLNLLDSGFRRNDGKTEELSFCEFINFGLFGFCLGFLFLPWSSDAVCSAKYFPAFGFFITLAQIFFLLSIG